MEAQDTHLTPKRSAEGLGQGNGLAYSDTGHKMPNEPRHASAVELLHAPPRPPLTLRRMHASPIPITPITVYGQPG